MSELLKKDTTIKILSIMFAVILWFVVNPIDSTSVSVPLTIRGEDTLKDKNLMLKNKDYSRTIEVVIRGNKEKIKKVNGYEFEAILDFSKINSSDERFLAIDGPKYIGKEEGIVIEKVLQDSVEVNLEKLEKNSFAIDIKTMGNFKAGYKPISITAIPDSITLQGPDSLIKSVSEIRTAINVNNIDRDVILKKQICKVYDADGKEIISLSRNLTVDVKVQVAKEVHVTLTVKGKPASDYTDGLRTVTPDKVLITGPVDVLSTISELKTEPVSIENKNKTVETESLITLPAGVKLVDIPREVSVSIIIERLSKKKFVISKDIISFVNISLTDSQSYFIKTESIEVGIKGSETKLGSLDVNDLKPNVDVGGLSEGVHRVPLMFDLPNGTNLDKEYYVEVEIQKVLPIE